MVGTGLCRLAADERNGCLAGVDVLCDGGASFGKLFRREVKNRIPSDIFSPNQTKKKLRQNISTGVIKEDIG